MDEIKNIVEILLLETKIKTRDKDLVSGFAKVFFPDEIKVKYYRDQDYSTVIGIAEVNANSDYFTLHATVRVELHYTGDMVRADQSTANKVMKRLDFLCHEICMTYIKNKLSNGEELNMALVAKDDMDLYLDLGLFDPKHF